jgi:hypothetical protein
MSFEIPQSWGKDPLSAHIRDAYYNCVASFVNYGKFPVVNALKEIDTEFRRLLELPFKPKRELFLPSFIGRSHAACLSAVQLSMAGQVPEAYPSIRLCLENALYALFIQDDPTIDEAIPVRCAIWLNRDTDEKKCRNTFTYRAVQSCLDQRDGSLGKRVSDLYDRTITYGAHPNFYGQAQAADLPTKGGGNVKYLLPNTTPSMVCVQTVVEVGISSLRIFELILGERFRQSPVLAKFDAIFSVDR